MRVLPTTLIFSFILLSATTGGAGATDLILGGDGDDKVALQIKKTSANPAAHKVQYSADDIDLVFTPGSGALDDPITNGATAVIFSATDCQCLSLAPAPTVIPGWTQKPASGTAAKYKWKDDVTKSTALVKGGKIKLKTKGGITYGLDTTPQGEVEVQITFGSSPDTFCTRFAAPAAKDDAATKYKSKVAAGSFGPTCSLVPTICPCAPGPPIVPDVNVTMDLRGSNGYGPATPLTENLLTGASSQNGEPLTASGGGTWTLTTTPLGLPNDGKCFVGDGMPPGGSPDTPRDDSSIDAVPLAGSFSVAADGTLSLDTGSAACGLAQVLRDGQIASATLSFSVSDGVQSTTGTVNVTVIGRVDPVVQIAEPIWPDNVIIDFGSPTPSLFDASGSFVSPDSPFVYSWSATSSGSVPSSPVFFANFDWSAFTIMNSEWGFDSQCTVYLTVVPYDTEGGGTVPVSGTDQASFFVTDAS